MSTKQSTMELMISIIVLLIVLGIYAVLARPKYTPGVLYMIGDEQPVCSGTLATSRNPYGGRSETFKCTDGREIKHLTNYILKEN